MDDYHIIYTPWTSIYKQVKKRKKSVHEYSNNKEKGRYHEGWPETGRESRFFKPGGDRREEGSLVAVW